MMSPTFYRSFPHFPTHGITGGLVLLLMVVAVAAAIVLRVTFLAPRNEGRFTGFTGWLYDFLNFRVGILRGLLLLLYLILCFVQIALSLLMVFSGAILGGLAALVAGQIGLRIFYELFLLMVNLCYNVMDINRKLGGGHSSQTQTPPSAQTPPQTPPDAAPQQPEF